jgi:hypothetical protein
VEGFADDLYVRQQAVRRGGGGVGDRGVWFALGQAANSDLHRSIEC